MAASIAHFTAYFKANGATRLVRAVVIPPYVPCSRALVLYMWALVCALSSLVTAWSFLCKPPVSLFVGEIPVLGFNALCAL